MFKEGDKVELTAEGRELFLKTLTEEFVNETFFEGIVVRVLDDDKNYIQVDWAGYVVTVTYTAGFYSKYLKKKYLTVVEEI